MENNHKRYNFLKNFLGVFFKSAYRPIYENIDRIPSEGPIIVCGNHIHLYDQCLPILSTKRMLHYMAKKEYFDGPFAWFFKASGCISVDRSIHDDSAKNKALEVLNNGYGLGIYPEGTRNQLASSTKKDRCEKVYEYFKNDMTYKEFYKIIKKNYVRLTQIDLLEELLDKKKITKKEFKKYAIADFKELNELVDKKIITKARLKEALLLPIRFGTVSMAQKTGATIVPYAITGKYDKSRTLKITFLETFKVGKDEDLEAANKKLTKILRDGIYEGNK